MALRRKEGVCRPKQRERATWNLREKQIVLKQYPKVAVPHGQMEKKREDFNEVWGDLVGKSNWPSTSKFQIHGGSCSCATSRRIAKRKAF